MIKLDYVIYYIKVGDSGFRNPRYARLRFGDKTTKALNVAQQMGQGTGKYIEGQGWQ